jgi:hypothetical protein
MLKKSRDRTANNIVNYVVTLRGVLPAQSSIDTVAIKGCNPGDDFGRKVAIGLKDSTIVGSSSN